MTKKCKKPMSLPAPPTPSDCDLRDFPFLPLHVVRFRDSGFAAIENAEAFRAGTLALCVAWHQVPAASLPDDDTELCRLLGYGRDLDGWKRLRADGALRGWVRCSDHRLHHPVLAGAARDAWRRKAEQRERTAAARAARLAKRSGGDRQEHYTELHMRALSQSDGASVTEDVTGSKGQGQGQGQFSPSTPSPNGEGSEGASPAGAGDPPAAVDGVKLPRVPPEIPRSLLLDMVAAWNEMAATVNLPQVKELNDRRAQALRARIRERWAKAPMEKWRAYLDAIEGTPFLVGGGARGWRADFDWALRPSSVLAVAEGKYRDEEPA